MRLTASRLTKCALFLAAALAVLGRPAAWAQENPSSANRTPSALGTIQSISSGALTLKTDAGAEIAVQLSADTKVLRVEPGSRSLKDAEPMQLSDLAAGDRVLVRGQAGAQANSLVATTIVAMKKEDIAKKQLREREEWQRHGIGGLVKSVDAVKETIVIGTLSAAGAKEVVIHAPVGTILRRYAPGSVSFDDAKIAPLSEVHEGDQLRARGSRSADGSEFTADEIVSGTFRNISGTIAAIDAAKSTLTVADLASKKNVELAVSASSQMRKLPAPMAQRIAARLKGATPESASEGGTPAPNAPPATAGGGKGPGGENGGRSGDMQQMLSRLPASALTEFQKGDAVMIVATASGDHATVITLLGGVEPILQSGSQASSILTPWSLNSGGGADAGTP